MKKGYTHIIMVLDRSGSMGSVWDDTMGGFNSFIKAQKKVPGVATVSLVQFDDQYEPLLDFIPLKEVKPLTRETYIPRGMTALLDAIGRTMVKEGEKLAAMDEDDRPDRVILVVITDGQENASSEYTRDRIFKLIRHQEETYSWKVVFIGANQDAIATGAQLGVMAANALTYAATAKGTQHLFSTVARSMAAYRTTDDRSVAYAAGFFTDDDRKKQEDELKKSNTVT